MLALQQASSCRPAQATAACGESHPMYTCVLSILAVAACCHNNQSVNTVLGCLPRLALVILHKIRQESPQAGAGRKKKLLENTPQVLSGGQALEKKLLPFLWIAVNACHGVPGNARLGPCAVAEKAPRPAGRSQPTHDNHHRSNTRDELSSDICSKQRSTLPTTKKKSSLKTRHSSSS